MNFKIQQTYPGPTQGLSNFNTVTYAQNINSLVLYGQQKLSVDSTAQPTQKKKIAFKVDKSVSAPSVDKISIFSIVEQKWSVVQAKGKIPSSRTQFKSIYMHPCIIMYGGKANGKNLNEVYALNCETWIWKKLFSIDGPPTSDDNNFFKISNLTAGLIVTGSLWLLQISDVKWQLSANQLPGSVWQKINVKIPENIQFCWPVSQQNLLIIGENQSVRINTTTKQKISQFEFNLKKLIFNTSKSQFKVINAFPETLTSEDNQILEYIQIVSMNSVNILKYQRKDSQNLNEEISALSQSKQKYKNYLQLDRPVKCCSYKSLQNKSNSNINQTSKSIYYIDFKGQLLSISLTPDPSLLNESNTVRMIKRKKFDMGSASQSNIVQQKMIENNSCILQEQENEQSSLLVPSTNSRIKFDNSRVQIQQQNQSSSQNEYKNQNTSGVQNKRDSAFERKNQNAQQNSFGNINNAIKNQQQNLKQEVKSSRQKNRPPNIVVATNLGTGRKNNYNISNSQTNPSQKTPNNERFKYKTQQHMDQNSQWQSNKNQREQKKQSKGTPQQIKQKLENILYNQSIKRKLLESKVEALQNIIKKSEKFVLVLCKYGNNHDKQKHIEKVRQIRQELEWNWNKQIYYRKQMEGNKLPSQISQQIEETMSNIEL